MRYLTNIALALGLASIVSAQSTQGLMPKCWSKEYADAQNTGRGLGSGATGVLKWKLPVRDGGLWDGLILGPDESLYLGSFNGTLSAVDTTKGSIVWTFTRQTSLNGFPALGANGLLYTQCQSGELYAVDSHSGSARWNSSTGDTTSDSPTIGRDGTVYLLSSTGGFYALNPVSGNAKWTQKNRGYMCCPAIGTAGELYITEFTNLTCVDPKTGGRRWTNKLFINNIGQPSVGDDGTIYVTTPIELLALDGVTGNTKWSYKVNGAGIEPPAIGKDGTVYITTFFGKIYGVNGKTGAQVWVKDLGFGIGFAHTAAVDAAGVVYVASTAGQLYALDGATGEQKWSFDLRMQSPSAPMVGADGTVYVVAPSSYLFAIH